ncbi:MAG: hypothetical protein H7Y15_08470 [Pseudonocardia sp.]|nr:hypothetical protein [Pseudonocardia sp.]
MRKAIQFVGVYLIASGISGVIDHVWYQPIMGIVLNAFHRVVLPRLDFLDGYEIFANLTVSAVGVVVVLAAEPWGRS